MGRLGWRTFGRARISGLYRGLFFGVLAERSLVRCCNGALDSCRTRALYGGSASTLRLGSAKRSTAAANSGTDPKSPLLAPDDTTFIDSHRGWDWSERCYRHLNAEKLGWARAACDRGMATPQLDPKARAALLYNEGLIAKEEGAMAAARKYLAESLALRHPTDPGFIDVQIAFASVGGKVKLGCEEMARGIVSSLPSVRQMIAADIVAANGSGGSLTFGGMGPMHDDDGGFSESVGIHHVDRFEAQVWYAVDRAGHLTVTSGGDEEIPAEAQDAVIRACKH